MAQSMRNQKVKKEEVQKLQIVIEKYIEIIKSCLPQFEEIKKENSFSKTYHYNFIERFLFAWISMNKLLPDITKSPGFNYPLGILARSVISDCITIIYLGSKIKPENNYDETEFKEKCKLLDFSFVRAKVQLFEGSNYTDEQLQQIFKREHERVKHIYPDFFAQTDGEWDLVERRRTPLDTRTMACPEEEERKKKEKENKGKKGKKEKQERIRLPISYFIFRLYSQYEHSTFFTKDMQNNFDRNNLHFLIETFRHTLMASLGILHFLGLIKKAIEVKSLITEIESLQIEFFGEPH